MATLADLAQEEFVSLTTYRRSGDAVSVAVWIAPATDARGGLLVTTTARSGKVKRLHRDRRVQLRPCDRRGAVAADAPTVAAQAEIVSAADEVRQMREAIRTKYGSRMKVTAADQGIVDPAEPARVILRITGSEMGSLMRSGRDDAEPVTSALLHPSGRDVRLGDPEAMTPWPLQRVENPSSTVEPPDGLDVKAAVKAAARSVAGRA